MIAPTVAERRICANSAGAPLALGRGRRGGRIFRRGQPPRAVAVGAAELVDRLHRPFLEREAAVAILVELGESLAARLEQFGAGDAPVVVLVGAGEPLLL